MTLSPAIKELLSLHEIFRRLGFLAKDLYVKFGICGQGSPPCKAMHAQFVLQHGGPDAEPVLRIDINEDCTDVEANWAAAVEWWNKACGDETAEVKAIYENSRARRNVDQLLLVLDAKRLITNPYAGERV